MAEAILIAGDAMGSPDEKLGQLLMGNFLRILGDREDLPGYIVLMNGGVRLATIDADTLDYLRKLEERGVRIIICRTCVEYYDVGEKLAVGQVDGMAHILDVLSAHQVMTI